MSRYDGYKRRHGLKGHIAVDTLGQLLAVVLAPANEQERSQVKALCETAQFTCGGTLRHTWADRIARSTMRRIRGSVAIEDLLDQSHIET